MVRRLLIASLPVIAAVGVAYIVLGTSSTPHRAQSAYAAEPPAVPGRTARQRRRPAPRLALHGARARRAAIPILVYHVIGTAPAGAAYPGLWVRPAEFAAQMHALRKAGYWAITLGRAWAAWTRGAGLPRKPVVVSFDDGYLGDFTHARPVLARLGWPGVLNLELANVGLHNLRASEVRALIRDGWEVDSHTVDHPDLTQASASTVRYELVASRRELLRRFGVRARFFCYPYGRYDAAVESAVRTAGYLAATTEDPGFATAANPFALPRLRVNANDTSATLLTRLAAGAR